MRLLHFIAIAISFIAISACSKESKVTIVPFKEHPISMLCNSNKELAEETFVITSSQEYASRINCMKDAPTIDFSTHFLLGGWIAFTNCANLVNQDVEIKNNTLHYQVRIDQADCQKLDTVYFMVSLPVFYEKYTVDFQVHD